MTCSGAHSDSKPAASAAVTMFSASSGFGNAVLAKTIPHFMPALYGNRAHRVRVAALLHARRRCGTDSFPHAPPRRVVWACTAGVVMSRADELLPIPPRGDPEVYPGMEM